MRVTPLGFCLRVLCSICIVINLWVYIIRLLRYGDGKMGVCATNSVFCNNKNLENLQINIVLVYLHTSRITKFLFSVDLAISGYLQNMLFVNRGVLKLNQIKQMYFEQKK